MLNVVVTATGPLFTLEEAKAHLNILHDDDDALIEIYSDAAVSHVLQYCNLATVPDGPGPEAAFKVAALLVLGDLYASRESDTPAGDPSRTVKMLIGPYRWLRV